MTKILKCFGCIEGEGDIGFPAADSGLGQNVDQILAPYLQTLAQFRTDIRNATKCDKDELPKKVTDL